MTDSVLDFSTHSIGSPRIAGELAVFPIISPNPAVSHWLTLSEALAKGVAHITEISDGGSVPTLLFRNDGETPVLLLDGEELVGAKQNRVLNLTILAPALSEIRIPVSCIEQGRWHWRSRHFEAANRTLYASARAEKMAQVSRSMRVADDYRSDQSAIWDSIHHKAANFDVRSSTGAASDIFDDRGSMLDQMVGEISAVSGQVGAAFWLRGELSGVELFGSADMFSRLLPKLVRSYGLDALDERFLGRRRLGRRRLSERATADAAATDIRAFLTALSTLPALCKPAIGLGMDLRLESDETLGAALIHEEQVVHLSAFQRMG